MKSKMIGTAIALFALFSAWMLAPGSASAHCDTMDGPVVNTAQEALDTGNLNPVLAWVGEKDAPEVTAAFNKALAVRKLSPEAAEMADQYFFETLVRVHRAGEGAPYTGLKPAGTDLGPVVPRADLALEKGSVDELAAMVSAKVEEGIRAKFNEALSKQSYDRNDVQAGREYVEAYVQYMHYVEGIYASAENPGSDHHAEGAVMGEQVGAHQEPASGTGDKGVTGAMLDAQSATASTAPAGQTTAPQTAAGMPRTGSSEGGSGFAIWALGGIALIASGIAARAVRTRMAR